MQGPLSYYRTGKVRFDEEKGTVLFVLSYYLPSRCDTAADLPSTLRADLPALFLWGTADPVSTPAQIYRAQKFIPQLEIVRLEGVGHWLMVESKQFIVEKVVDWLNTVVHRPKANL
jgi:soluble epoxide hydrolase/lipid-phosphate phosphatase